MTAHRAKWSGRPAWWILALLLVLLLPFTFRPAPRVPSFKEVRADWRPSDAQLLDRRGEVIHALRVNPVRRRLDWTPLADLSPALVRLVIASEDRRFFRHGGVDFRALGAAARARASGGPSRGASTITMQFAALLDSDLVRGDRPRTMWLKWIQMRLAWGIERRWSKREILEAYLNLVTFRGELEGAAAASSVLFGKAPHGITEPEALILAVLLRAPAAGRDAMVYRAMALAKAARISTPTGAIVLAAGKAAGVPRGTGPRVVFAPHAARILLRAGSGPRSVRTTLDADLQRFVSETLVRQLFVVRDQRVRDGAALVVDNATGDVLAYVGGSGDLSSARFVDGVRARRQAGSSLKPFLYGLALEKRLLTPASLLEDAPLEIPVSGGL